MGGWGRGGWVVGGEGGCSAVAKQTKACSQPPSHSLLDLHFWMEKGMTEEFRKKL